MMEMGGRKILKDILFLILIKPSTYIIIDIDTIFDT